MEFVRGRETAQSLRVSPITARREIASGQSNGSVEVTSDKHKDLAGAFFADTFGEE